VGCWCGVFDNWNRDDREIAPWNQRTNQRTRKQPNDHPHTHTHTHTHTHKPHKRTPHPQTWHGSVSKRCVTNPRPAAKNGSMYASFTPNDTARLASKRASNSSPPRKDALRLRVPSAADPRALAVSETRLVVWVVVVFFFVFCVFLFFWGGGGGLCEC
jgi:hypothetical protein